MPYQIEYICLCHPGRVRQANQDNLNCRSLFLPMENRGLERAVRGRVSAAERPLFGIYDGMGGEERGEAASFIAARTAAGWETDAGELSLEEYCRETNRRICAFARRNLLVASGTTAAMLLFDEDGTVCCNVGDSRIYLLRDGRLIQLSEDQVEPEAYGGKPALLQFLGLPEEEAALEPHIVRHSVRADDRFLICSDGLTDMLMDGEIGGIMEDGDIGRAAELLLEEALLAGGRDNVTLTLLRAEAGG